MKKGLIGAVAMVVSYLWMTFPVSAEAPYEYTLFIYLNGSDLESEYEAATDDLLEMLQGTVAKDVAVIIETGGTAYWYSQDYGLPRISSTVNQRWKVTEDQLEFLGSVGKHNMGAASTLESFLEFGMINYPADQYGLIMWNHGAGAIYGYGADEHFDYDTLTLDEFQTALEANNAVYNNRFDFVGFDACLMGSIETAHVLAPYADYFVGSEELEPGHGWSYEQIMDVISSEADPDPIAIGKTIIDGFKAQSEAYDTAEAITLSLIDLSKVDEVQVAMDALFQRVLWEIDDEILVEAVLRARLNSESYGEGNNASDIPDSDMVDMVDFATEMNELFPVQAENLVLSVYDAVRYNINSPYKPNAQGLSLYIPAKDKDTMQEAGAALEAIGMSATHVRFVETINSIINGTNEGIEIQGTIVDVTENEDITISLEDYSIEGDESYYYFNLDPEDLSAIDEIVAVMGVIEPTGDIQYLAKDRVADDTINTDGTIIGETLEYWVSIEGIQVAMYYESYNNKGVINYFIPVTLNGEDADLMVLFSDAHPNGKILGARKLNTGNENVYNRSLISLKPEDVIEFVYEYDGYDINTGTYFYDGWYVVDAIRIGDGLSLDWAPLAAGEYAYSFEITDIYGELYQTDWIIYEQTGIAQTGNTADDAIWDNQHENTIQGEGSYVWLAEGVTPPSDWAVPYVQTAYNNGLTTERTLVDFAENITREEFCELVVRMVETATGKPIAVTSPVVFADTENLAVAKAYQLGIVDGYGNGRFGPDDEITREQLITMFFRALTIQDATYETLSYPELQFGDSDQVSDWAQKGSKCLVSLKLIDGVGNNLLAPKNTATIEQSLKLVNGVYEYYLGQ